jgi:uncharacterized surface anchored protein
MKKKTINKVKRGVCAATATMATVISLLPTGVGVTTVHADLQTNVTGEQLYTVARSALEQMAANSIGDPYPYWGTCTGGMGNMLKAVDQVYGTSFSEIGSAYFINTPMVNLVDHQVTVTDINGVGHSVTLQSAVQAKYSPDNSIAALDAMCDAGLATHVGPNNGVIGIDNMDSDADAAGLQDGDIAIFESYSMGGYSSSGHEAIIHMIDGQATVIGNAGNTGGGAYDLYFYDQRPSIFLHSYNGTFKGGPMHVYRIANNQKDVTISLHKSSTNSVVTDKNSCYSLENAVYRIYDNNGTQLGDIKTDANGDASGKWTVDPGVSSLQYQEIVAPKGYTLDSTVYPAELNSDNHADVTAADKPGGDPMVISLNKQVEEGAIIKEMPSLANAEFTIKYYDLDPDTATIEQTKTKDPTKTWVVKTKWRDDYQDYVALLTKEFLVQDRSDALYPWSDGTNAIPVGVFTVQETKIPDATVTIDGKTYPVFTIENTIINQITGHQTTQAEDGTAFFVVKDTGDHKSFRVDGLNTASNEYRVKEVENRGGLKIQKHDSGFAAEYGVENSARPQGDAQDLTTTYTITNLNSFAVEAKNGDTSLGTAAANGGTLSFKITTDKNGYWESASNFLPVGNYKISEENAPAGYLIESSDDTELATSAPFSIKTNDDIANLTGVLGDDIIRGGFSVQKYDAETAIRSQGDTDLKASFALYNASANEILYRTKDAKGNTVDIPVAKDGLIKTFDTDKKGFYQSVADELPYGSYRLVETAAPKGYTLNADNNYTFKVLNDGDITKVAYKENKLTDGDLEDNISNAVKNTVGQGRFTIHKTLSDSTDSSFSHNEAGATFVVVLKKYVQEFADKNTGDDKGNITWQNVIDAYNAHDSWTGKDNEGNDAVGYTEREYDAITTDDEGNATSRYLAYGQYVLTQSKSTIDEAHIIKEVVDFNVKDINASVPAYKQADVHYEASNQPEQYSLRIYKHDLQTDELVTLNSADFKIKQLTKLVNGKEVEVNEYLKQKVGSQYYDVFRTVSDNEADERHPAGTFYSAEEPSASVATPLKVDAGTYQIEELPVSFDRKGTPESYTTMDPIKVTVSAHSINRVEDDADGDRVIRVEAYNKQITGKLTVNKSIADYTSDFSLINRDDLSGFGFTLTADEDIYDPANGNKIMSAGDIAKNIYGETVGYFNVDKDGNAVIEELPLGKYSLKETRQPAGTVTNTKSYHYTFAQKTTGGILGIGAYSDSNLDDYEKDSKDNPCVNATENIVNDSIKTPIYKKDATGSDEVKGAQLAVMEGEKEIVSWTSDGTAFRIEGLQAGKTYTLVEKIAAEGFVKASSIDFVMTDTGVEQPVTMIDKIVTLTKEDENGKEVPGALITITDKDGNTVDNWTSTTEAHKIKNLEVGKTYTITETSAPDGYYYAASTTFTVKDDGIDQAEKLVDNVIHYQIAKVDDNGNYVNGVTLKLTDTTTDTAVTLPNNGITTDEPFELDGKLIAGHKYLLEESEYVAGVYKATSVEFEVAKTGTTDVTTITMKDLTTVIAIQKVDNHGNPVAGAKLQILEATTDKDGNIVPAVDEDGKVIVLKEYTSTSDAAGIDISKDVMGDKTYILRESEAPFGFDLSKDVTFTVTGTKEKAQVIMMTDVRKTYYVSAVKVDAQDQTKLLPGAEITLFLKDGSVAKDINGNECKGTTDGQGVITWNVEYNGDLGGYYVQETAAPLGYRINSNHYDVTLSENYDFAKDNAVKIVVNDEAAPIDEGRSPDTGDKTSSIVWGSVLIVSLGALLFVIKYKNKSKN